MGQGSSALAALQAEIVESVTDNDANRLYQLITVARQHALGQISVVAPGSGPSSPASPPARSALGGLSSLVSIKGKDGSTMSATQYIRSIISTGDSTAAAPYHVMKDDGTEVKPLKLPPPALSAPPPPPPFVEAKEKSEPAGYQPPRPSAGAMVIDPAYQTHSQPPPPPPTTPAPPLVTSPLTSPAHSIPAERNTGLGGFKPTTLPIDLNTLYINGESLVHHCAKHDKHEVLFLLVQAGADLHAVDNLGWTPLHSAAAAGSIRSVRVCVGVGANPLAKSRLGLTPSQCTTHPEIKRELEKEEFSRRDALEEQIKAMTATVAGKGDSAYNQSLYGPIAGQNTMIAASTLPPFDPGLYHVSCAVEVRAGDKLDILYRAPINHSPLDCFCLYYVEDERRPWLMRPRFGSTFYVPVTPQQMVGGIYATITIIATTAKMPPATYRILYYDAVSQTFPAASNAFKVIAQPSSAGFSMNPTTMTSWFDPSSWSNTQAVDITSSGATSTPIVLHAEFQTLSELTLLSLGSFLLPVPPYFLFNFVLNPLAVRMALELDPRLAQARDALVPHRMKEKEFWQSYFYQMVALDFVQQDTADEQQQHDQQQEQEHEQAHHNDNGHYDDPPAEHQDSQHYQTDYSDPNAPPVSQEHPAEYGTNGVATAPADPSSYDYTHQQTQLQQQQQPAEPPEDAYFDPYAQHPDYQPSVQDGDQTHPQDAPVFAATETPRLSNQSEQQQSTTDATYYDQQHAGTAYSATPDQTNNYNHQQIPTATR